MPKTSPSLLRPARSLLARRLTQRPSPLRPPKSELAQAGPFRATGRLGRHTGTGPQPVWPSGRGRVVAATFSEASPGRRTFLPPKVEGGEVEPGHDPWAWLQNWYAGGRTASERAGVDQRRRVQAPPLSERMGTWSPPSRGKRPPRERMPFGLGPPPVTPFDEAPPRPTSGTPRKPTLARMTQAMAMLTGGRRTSSKLAKGPIRTPRSGSSPERMPTTREGRRPRGGATSGAPMLPVSRGGKDTTGTSRTSSTTPPTSSTPRTSQGSPPTGPRASGLVPPRAPSTRPTTSRARASSEAPPRTRGFGSKDPDEGVRSFTTSDPDLVVLSPQTGRPVEGRLRAHTMMSLRKKRSALSTGSRQPRRVVIPVPKIGIERRGGDKTPSPKGSPETGPLSRGPQQGPVQREVGRQRARTTGSVPPPREDTSRGGDRTAGPRTGTHRLRSATLPGTEPTKTPRKTAKKKPSTAPRRVWRASRGSDGKTRWTRAAPRTYVGEDGKVRKARLVLRATKDETGRTVWRRATPTGRSGTSPKTSTTPTTSPQGSSPQGSSPQVRSRPGTKAVIGAGRRTGAGVWRPGLLTAQGPAPSGSPTLGDARSPAKKAGTVDRLAEWLDSGRRGKSQISTTRWWNAAKDTRVGRSAQGLRRGVDHYGGKGVGWLQRKDAAARSWGSRTLSSAKDRMADSALGRFAKARTGWLGDVVTSAHQGVKKRSVGARIGDGVRSTKVGGALLGQKDKAVSWMKGAKGTLGGVFGKLYAASRGQLHTPGKGLTKITARVDQQMVPGASMLAQAGGTSDGGVQRLAPLAQREPLRTVTSKRGKRGRKLRDDDDGEEFHTEGDRKGLRRRVTRGAKLREHIDDDHLDEHGRVRRTSRVERLKAKAERLERLEQLEKEKEALLRGEEPPPRKKGDTVDHTTDDTTDDEETGEGGTKDKAPKTGTTTSSTTGTTETSGTTGTGSGGETPRPTGGKTPRTGESSVKDLVLSGLSPEQIGDVARSLGRTPTPLAQDVPGARTGTGSVGLGRGPMGLAIGMQRLKGRPTPVEQTLLSTLGDTVRERAGLVEETGGIGSSIAPRDGRGEGAPGPSSRGGSRDKGLLAWVRETAGRVGASARALVTGVRGTGAGPQQTWEAVSHGRPEDWWDDRETQDFVGLSGRAPGSGRGGGRRTPWSRGAPLGRGRAVLPRGRGMGMVRSLGGPTSFGGPVVLAAGRVVGSGTESQGAGGRKVVRTDEARVRWAREALRGEGPLAEVPVRAWVPMGESPEGFFARVEEGLTPPERQRLQSLRGGGRPRSAGGGTDQVFLGRRSGGTGGAPPSRGTTASGSSSGRPRKPLRRRMSGTELARAMDWEAPVARQDLREEAPTASVDRRKDATRAPDRAALERMAEEEMLAVLRRIVDGHPDALTMLEQIEDHLDAARRLAALRELG